MKGLPVLHLRLWQKLAAAIALLVSASMVLLGITEMLFSYREAVAQAGRAQSLLAGEVAGAVRSSLGGVERQLAAVAALPWERAGWLASETRREEFHRLLLVAPAVESVSLIDGEGHELLTVSRRDTTRASAGAVAGVDASVPPTLALTCVYGAIEYAQDYDPSLSLAISATDRTHSRMQARVNLRALVRELAVPLATERARVYAVDQRGVVVLHSDTGLLIERRRSPSVAVTQAQQDHDVVAASGPGLNGDPVIASSTFLPGVNWRVVVEQPRSLALQPAFDTLSRTAAFTAIGVALAMAVSFLLAGRLARPVAALHRGAAALGEGRLDTRIHVETGDELEALAGQFNRMAANLEDLYAGLEERVREKTRELELANRHKSEFLTNMSHELRTPLNAVIGFSDAMLDETYGPLSEGAARAVQDIREAGEHQLSLINDLLDLAKIEAGRMELDLEPVDVARVVANSAAFVRERCQRKALALEVRVDPALDTWLADARRVKQMLANLLANAVKFTPQGGRIAVTARVEGGWLALAVSDTGVGISPEDLPQLFREFSQLRRSGAPERGTPGKEEGTGLGLALVRQFARLHGGDVSVSSRPGEGSTFTVRLPAQPPTTADTTGGPHDGQDDPGDR